MPAVRGLPFGLSTAQFAQRRGPSLGLTFAGEADLRLLLTKAVPPDLDQIDPRTTKTLCSHRGV
jgi:hypothetical protein